MERFLPENKYVRKDRSTISTQKCLRKIYKKLYNLRFLKIFFKFERLHKKIFLGWVVKMNSLTNIMVLLRSFYPCNF